MLCNGYYEYLYDALYIKYQWNTFNYWVSVDSQTLVSILLTLLNLN